MRDSVIRLQLDGEAKFIFSARQVAVVVELDEAERGVRFGQLVVSLDGAKRGLLGMFPCSRRRRLDIPVQQGITVSHLCIGERELRIAFNRALKPFDSLA